MNREVVFDHCLRHRNIITQVVTKHKWANGLITAVLVACFLLFYQANFRFTYNMTTSGSTTTGDIFEAQYNDSNFSSGKGYRTLPHCIIIGVRKAGTKALIQFLKMNPHIAAKRKEAHFFDNNGSYSKGLNFYLDSMPISKPGQIVMEKTPQYFLKPYVPERIKKMNEAIKLLLIVRDPVRRMISEYVHFDLLKGNNAPFESLAILPNGEINEQYSRLQNSKYYYNLKHWLQFFPLKQIHIVDGNRLIQSPFQEIRKIETFLGLKHKIAKKNFYFDKKKGYYCPRSKGKSHCLGKSKGRTQPEVDPLVIKQLRKYFKPYNQLFFELSKRNFDW